MGCATSKPKVCRNCQGSYSPVRRSDALRRSVDNYHLVSLTSSSLELDQLIRNHRFQNPHWIEAPIDLNKATSIGFGDDEIVRAQNGKTEFAMSIIEAKTWSEMITDKIPKLAPVTPNQTPPGEPESINAWELMEGLEDISPLRPIPNHLRRFSFQLLHPLSTDDQPTPRVKENVVSEFDCVEKQEDLNGIEISTKPDKLIMFFTSLRGVRKTYEDCCHVRVILKGLGVKIDERDVSMHSGFKDELKDLLGESLVGVGLPRVFLGKKYIGGADEIRRLNEDRMLEKLVEGCELVEDCGVVEGGSRIACEACGDVRFVPCQTCSGSCKVFYEAEYVEDEEEYNDECGFQRCPDCNENGLVRCPICCD